MQRGLPTYQFGPLARVRYTSRSISSAISTRFGMPIPRYMADRFGEQLAGLDAVAGAVAVDEHAGVPATHLGLGHDDRHVMRQAQRLLVLRFRLLPAAAAGRDDAGSTMGRAERTRP